MDNIKDLELLEKAKPANGSILLVTVKGNHSILFIDEQTGDLLTAISVGSPIAQPHEIILSDNGNRAFVSLYGDAAYPENNPNNQIAILDVPNMCLEKTICTNLYRGPHGMARDALKRIWVTMEVNKCIVVVDPESCEIKKTIFTESGCHFLSTSPDRNIVYSGHKEIPYIGVYDSQNMKMIDKISLPVGSQAMSHAPNDEILFVGDFFRPMLHVIDTNQKEIVRTISLKGVPGWPYATSDGKNLIVSTYLAEKTCGYIEIFDAKSFQLKSVTEFSAEPFHVLADLSCESLFIALSDGELVKMNIESAELQLYFDCGPNSLPEQIVRFIPS